MLKMLLIFPFIYFIYGCNNTINNTITQKKGFTITPDTLVFKELKYADTFRQTIYCKNFSELKIKILQIENGCGCTSGILKDSVIEINDSVPVMIKYIPSYSKDTGTVIKYLTIRTNSNPPFKNIIMKGNVIK